MDLVNGIPPEGTSPILTTNVDEFAHEEISHLAAFTEVGAALHHQIQKATKALRTIPPCSSKTMQRRMLTG